MGKVIIEWLHYEKEDQKCSRCGESAGVIEKVIKGLRVPLQAVKIEIELRNIVLKADQISLSNTVRINGKEIMELLGEDRPPKTFCPSCSALIGEEVSCGTFAYKGKTYDSLPEAMLMDAILRAVPPPSMGGCCCR